VRSRCPSPGCKRTPGGSCGARPALLHRHVLRRRARGDAMGAGAGDCRPPIRWLSRRFSSRGSSPVPEAAPAEPRE
jgi:hypothetical protein